MSKTVLVADESVTIRSVAESLLRGEAYSVRSAADGNMALEMAKTEMPDLVLVGEQLPGLSGTEVCQAMKSDPALRDVPVIFMRADRPGSAPDEADEVLTKPFSPQALLEMVHRFLYMDDSATTELVTPVDGQAVSDELIDQALGIDDVGPAPALEMEVNRGGELADLNSDEQAGESGSPEETPSFGTLEEEKAVDAPTVDSDPLEFSTQVGLEDAPPAGKGAGSELDRALDMAFGGTPKSPSSTAGPSSPPPPVPIEEPQSSLEEISLGDPDPVKIPEPTAPAELAAPKSHSLDPLSMDDEPEPERPHDYDWFIKEMEKESASGSAAKKETRADERPRIEPVLPDPSAPAAKTGIDESTRFVPVSAEESSTRAMESGAGEVPSSKRGYDEFISEFRREIAKLEGALPQEASSESADRMRDTQSAKMALRESPALMASPPAEIREMANQLIDSVTQSVARELAAKIDPNAIYALIEQKLKEQSRRES